MVQGTRNVVAAAQRGRRAPLRARERARPRRALAPRCRTSRRSGRWSARSRRPALEHVIFRPSFVFGKDGGVLPTFVRLARFAPVTPIVGPGRSTSSRSGSTTSPSTSRARSSCPRRRTGRSSSAGPTRRPGTSSGTGLKRVLGSRRPSVHLPIGLMRAQAAVTEKLPGAPVTRDQLTMLALGDNVVADQSARSRRSGCSSCRSRSSCAERRRDARRRLRRGGRAARGRGDHARRAGLERGAGAHRGVRRLPHRSARRRDGRLGHGFPILLGHEGAGIVEEVGAGVETVAPGDRVVIAWRAPCGDSCRACRRGDPRRCSNNLRAGRRAHRALDGAVLSPVLRCGTFADRAIVHEACAVKLPDALPVGAGVPLGVRLLDGRRRRALGDAGAGRARPSPSSAAAAWGLR